MKTTKITPELIYEAIEHTSRVYMRKCELYEQVKKINSELVNLYESAPPLVSTFGFKLNDDIGTKSPTGFLNTPNISHIARLEAEMEEHEGEALNETEILKQENELLKKQIEELRAKSA